MALLSGGTKIDVSPATFVAGAASLGVFYGTVAHGLGTTPHLVTAQLASVAGGTIGTPVAFGIGGNASVSTWAIVAGTINNGPGAGAVSVTSQFVHSIPR